MLRLGSSTFALPFIAEIERICRPAAMLFSSRSISGTEQAYAMFSTSTVQEIDSAIGEFKVDALPFS